MNNLSESDKQILKSVAPLVIVIILFIISGRFAISKVTDIRKQITDAKKVQLVLNNKLKTLSTISQNSGASANLAVMAFPKSNPALQLFSQIKILAGTNQLILSNIKSSIGSAEGDNLSFLNTTFDITGSRNDIFSFIFGTSGIAPLTFIQKVDFTENQGAYTANITARTYFAPLPSTIPTVTQAVTDLSSVEKNLLAELGTLSQPITFEVSYATVSATNPNPFGQ